MDVFTNFSGAKTYELTQALLLYTVGEGDNTIATVHSAVKSADGTAPMLGPGRALTLTALGEIARSLSQAPEAKTLIPEHLLYVDDAQMVWYRPAHRGVIYFRTGRADWNEKMGGAVVLHPSLLFRAAERSLSVWALAGDARPNLTTPLYQAPYFNMYRSGAMCIGSSPLPSVISSTDMQAWESAFFETIFTHTNVHPERDLVAHPRGHDGFWQAMARRNAVVDPSWLVPVGKTLGEVIS